MTRTSTKTALAEVEEANPLSVIFLDYDGVLNRCAGDNPTPSRTVNGILVMADPEIVYRLNLVVDRTGAEIVLSSSWRHLPYWKEALKLSGIVKKPLDRTPRYSSWKKYGIKEEELCRGHNIQDWLDDHPVERYAIVDDSADMLDHQLSHFFKTDPAFGLTQEIADAIEAHLTSSPSHAH